MSSPSTSTGTDVDAVGLVTAAGLSTRMGGFPKPLLHFDGQRFVERIVDQYRRAGVEDVLVVLGHEAAAVEAGADLTRATVVVNEDYHDGMLSSVRLGVEHAMEHDRDGVFLWPVDYPCVEAPVVTTLWEHLHETGADVAVPTVGGERGHPALFAASTFGALLDAPATEGARAVVYDDDTHVETVAVDDERILVDIDEPAEYWAAVKRYELGRE